MADEIALTKVTLAGPNMKVEREVDGATALRIVAVLLGGDAGSPARGREHGDGGSGGQRQTLSELFVTSDPKRNPDRVATAAYYLAESGAEPFTREQIRTTLRDARQKSFGNFGRDFDWAVKNGWLDGTDAAGYVLTTSGRTAVDAHFEKAVRAKTRLVNKGARRGKKKKATESDT